MPLGAGNACPTLAPELSVPPSPKCQTTSTSAACTRTVSGPADAVASGICGLPLSQNQDGRPVRPFVGLVPHCSNGHGCAALACCASSSGDGAGAPGWGGAPLPTQTTPSGAPVAS